MTKGVKSEINGMEYSVLDVRITGSETAIDIAVSGNVKRGIAIIKLYGPNRIKGFVVTGS